MNKNLSIKEKGDWVLDNRGSLWKIHCNISELTHLVIIVKYGYIRNNYTLMCERGNRFKDFNNLEKIYDLLNNLTLEHQCIKIQSKINFENLITNKTYKVLFTNGDKNE